MVARMLRESCSLAGTGETVTPDPRLRFGEAGKLWLAGPVQDLHATRQAATGVPSSNILSGDTENRGGGGEDRAPAVLPMPVRQ